MHIVSMRGRVHVGAADSVLSVRAWQPEAVKVPVQVHGGEEDAMKGLSDPEVPHPHGMHATGLSC